MKKENRKNGIKTDIKPKLIKRDKKGLFQKGTAPGPGREEGTFSLKTILTNEIQKQPEGQQLTYALALIKKQLRQAIGDGDQPTQKLIWNYLEGMPKESAEVKGDITIIHKHYTVK